MESRLNKYSNPNLSRVDKNQNLYKEINRDEIASLKIKSNATVIGDNANEIDIEKIKSILDKRYNDTPKRKSIRIEQNEMPESKVFNDDTKEYDLNVVLERALDEKNETYEDDRAKSLKNTQYNILSNLNINSDSIDKQIKDEEDKEELMELINTITINETKGQDESTVNPLDILSDLKGSDNTEVYEQMHEELKEKPEEVKEVLKKEVSEKEKIDNTFYTNNLFKTKDFDNTDFLEEDEKLNKGIKILIILVVIVFIVGLFLFLKSFLNF